MSNHEFDRRQFLKYGGALGAAGLSSLSGCMMVEGSMGPNMKPLMQMGLPVTRGGPGAGNYPAEVGEHPIEKVAKKEEKMDALATLMIAYENQTNNYHFIPHVQWVEPGTSVFWKHTNMGISEDTTHTTTAVTSNTMPGYPRLIPVEADAWDTGFMPGAMKSEFEYVTGDDDGTDIAVKDDPGPGVIEHGPFKYTFTERGVYIFLCQNHFGFGMAGAVVVGDQWKQNRGEGWSPGMTQPINPSVIEEEDPRFAKTISMKINQAIRPFIWNGKKSKKVPASPPWM